MSFLKIKDPTKRDAIVKEYLELKKNIRDNLLSERTGELELQTDLSKFYRPITETQKATAREITEGLKPIREGIEKLPQAITFPTTQPLGEASGQEEEEEDESVGDIAKIYLKIPPHKRDTTFGILKEKGHHYIGNKHVIVENDDIILDDGDEFTGTHALWKLITSKNPNLDTLKQDKLDEENYARLMLKTNVLRQNNNPHNPKPKSSRGDKWNNILSEIWSTGEFPKKKKGYEGEGVVVIPSDPNELVERLDLLLASQEAGHTGVGNELVSICDELRRQGVLDTKNYKKLNSIIKK